MIILVVVAAVFVVVVAVVAVVEALATHSNFFKPAISRNSGTWRRTPYERMVQPRQISTASKPMVNP